MKIFKYIVLVIIINILFTGCFLSTNINSGGQVGMSVGGTVFLKKFLLEIKKALSKNLTLRQGF